MLEESCDVRDSPVILFCVTLKEGDFSMKLSELEEEVRHREITLRNFEEEIRNLRTGISDMSKELDMKGKEILRIRSEANQAAR